MLPDDEPTATEAAQEQDDFAAGFSDNKPSGKTTAKPAQPKPEAAPEKAPAAAEAKPEYVQINAKDWAEVQAAARKTASYDAQLSKAFGTIGNLQKQIAESRKDAPTATRKVEIPKAAFEAMAKDFPELAEHNRAALEAALATLNLDPNSSLDEDKVRKAAKSIVVQEQMDDLEETYPDWRAVVGAPTPERDGPDLGSPYRKWLATKDAGYQAKLNETDSPAVIQRSITLFRRETRVAPKPAPEKPREDARADRIRAAVQPKGDNAAAPPGKTDEDEFAEGFRNARG